MKVIDTHCDALLKLQLAKNGQPYGVEPISFYDADELERTVGRLKEGQGMAQFFARFIYPDVPDTIKWQKALEQVDLFYTEILGKNPQMKHITKWEQLDELEEGEIGAVLTLEGADAFGNDLMKLRQLYRLGVMSLGMTWNNANLCADGVGESRGGGLTDLGREVVRLNNEHKVFTDVAHASLQTFWDIMDEADYVMASHANARAIHDHGRNLYDDQVKAIIDKGGLIHVVYYSQFVNGKSDGGTISDLIKHIDHLCELGGVNHIGFGSDFDGINGYLKNLKHAGHHQNLVNELLKHYSEEEVKGFAYQNFLNNRPK